MVRMIRAATFVRVRDRLSVKIPLHSGDGVDEVFYGFEDRRPKSSTEPGTKSQPGSFAP